MSIFRHGDRAAEFRRRAALARATEDALTAYVRAAELWVAAQPAERQQRALNDFVRELDLSETHRAVVRNRVLARWGPDVRMESHVEQPMVPRPISRSLGVLLVAFASIGCGQAARPGATSGSGSPENAIRVGSALPIVASLLRLETVEAVTLGQTIYVRSRSREDASLLRHEQEHARQWREYGALGFPLRYVAASVLCLCFVNGYELAARQAARQAAQRAGAGCGVGP